MILSFGFLTLYISYTARDSLVEEKKASLTNEAKLISDMSVKHYMNGEISDFQLTADLNYYSKLFQSDIWCLDSNGNIYARSNRDITYVESPIENEENPKKSNDSANIFAPLLSDIPNNIYMINTDYDMANTEPIVGDFYGIFKTDVITVNLPIISSDQTPKGAILIHSSMDQINHKMMKTYSSTLIPCLIIIVIAFSFIAIVSKKIIKPIKHLSSVARDYSEGNFDVKTGIQSKDEIGQLADSMEYMADELSKLDQYRHDFVSNISHDFRSPLTSIKGYVSAMLDGTIPPNKQERYLNIVLDETQRLTKLTQGLLDLNHLEIYGPYLKMSEFDFIDVVKATLNTFEIKCIDKGIAIYLNNHATNTVVTADQTKIQQVIYNLIDNAIKFTPSGKKINVSIHETNDKLYVTVKDEGIGMSEDTQRKIWTRFYKGDQSRGKDKQGTGLGLAITKEIIKAHNETIEVSSTEGEGSKFVFSLTKAKQEPSHTGQTEILIANSLR
jgi:signal transduction histidine kinase